MKILKFIANNVHGLHDYNIEFNSDITFLVGINGGGKTTILRLIQAVLTLDFGTLFSIKFDLIEISIDMDNKNRKIKLLKNKDHLKFSLDEGEGVLIPIVKIPERERSREKAERYDYFVEDLRIKIINENGDKLNDFFKWQKPLFLGLERRSEIFDEEADYEVDLFGSRRLKTRGRSIVEGLESCQKLIEREYRKYRRFSDNFNKRLVDTIVDSAFDYIEFESNLFIDKKYRDDLYKDVISRRSEMEEFARGVDAGRNLAVNKIKDFYDKIIDVFNQEKIGGGGGDFSIELIMNISQLKRIRAILAEMDSQKRISKKRYEPIDQFVKGVNEFFKDSKKSINVDPLGRLVVIQAGQTISLECLSSGEKQLIILLAHAKFARSRGGIVIVDEPEISLHLRWQEILVDGLSISDSEAQFIFATHSPEIVGFKKNKAILVG